jgi:hypothetical protein
MSQDEKGGLAPWAVDALGFDLMCQCGHEEGYHCWHERATSACGVLDCDCQVFRSAEQETPDMIPRDLTDAELIDRLRRCAGIWFKNSDLLLLEQLIKRFMAVSHTKQEERHGSD